VRLPQLLLGGVLLAVLVQLSPLACDVLLLRATALRAV
jgi:hypothetical protein